VHAAEHDRVVIENDDAWKMPLEERRRAIEYTVIVLVVSRHEHHVREIRPCRVDET